MDVPTNGQAPGVEGLTEPLSPRTGALLRQAVREHAGAGRRRADPVLHVGVPGGHRAELVLDPDEPTDPGLRTDLVSALRQRVGPHLDPMVWLSRSGEPDLEDVDARWLSAARAAYAEARAPLVFVVVTRRGWRDPRSGLARTWARPRP